MTMKNWIQEPRNSVLNTTSKLPFGFSSSNYFGNLGGIRQNLKDEDIKAVCLKLCEFSEIKSLCLKLSENSIGNLGLVYIGKFLSLVQLESLEIYLRGNKYDSKAATFLISQICKQTSLKNLKLSFWKYSSLDWLP